jgi:hypothetical protein
MIKLPARVINRGLKMGDLMVMKESDYLNAARLIGALQNVADAARNLKNYQGDHREEQSEWLNLWHQLDDALKALDQVEGSK